MNKSFYITLMAVVFLAGAGRAQDYWTNAAPRTDIEIFEAQTNTVIVKGVSLINTINMSSGSLSVRAKESKEPSSGHVQYGMMVEFALNSEGRERERAVMDYTELNSMLDGIDYIKKMTSDSTDMSGFEAQYMTKSGFKVIAFSSRREGNVQIFVQFDGCLRISLTSDQVSQFRDVVSAAKNTLDALQAGK
jgi:hypothetical protein